MAGRGEPATESGALFEPGSKVEWWNFSASREARAGPLQCEALKPLVRFDILMEHSKCLAAFLDHRTTT